MSNPLEEPLNEFFNRITALDRVLQVIKSQGGIPKTHTTISQTAAWNEIYALRIPWNRVDVRLSST